MDDLTHSEWTLIRGLVYREMQKFKVDGPIYPMLNSIYTKILYKEGYKNGKD